MMYMVVIWWFTEMSDPQNRGFNTRITRRCLTLDDLGIPTLENLHVATGQNHRSLFFTPELMVIILLDSRGSNPV